MEESDEEIVLEFILEAREILDALDQDFVQLELKPDDPKLIGNIFRGMHTLKGSSGVFAYKRLEKLAHAAESLMSALREGTLQFDSNQASSLLKAVDIIRDIVTNIDLHRLEPEGNDDALVSNLLALSQGLVPAPIAIAPTPSPAIAPMPSLAAPEATAGAVAAVAAPPATQTLPAAPLATDPDESQHPDQDSTEIDVAKSRSAKPNEQAAAPVKVSLEVLDKLINVASEMVLARNRLLPFANVFRDPVFSSAVRSIDLLTRELQERMMTTRMEPISQVWMKFPRLVRDISAELGKKVEVIQEGADTELDRTLLDTIRDPLIHIIRNCVDHGIEMPSSRLENGKPEIGRILLRANHENGMVVIEVADDGAGIDYEAVREKVIEKNLADKENALQFNDSQLLPFIFLPGFSTKKVVTNLSGRGVGADVVKTNIANIGGSVEVESHRGRGTNMRLKIPLTLAIMPALFVRCQGERYAIPQNSIVEMIHLDAKRNEAELEDFYGVPVFRLRGQLVPLLFLSKQLMLDAPLPAPGQGLQVAILQSYGVLFGLAVDEVLDIQEVVVKTLGQGLKDISEFAGATILGDGRVSLILHVDGIATNSGLVAKLQSRALNPEKQLSDSVAAKETSILLFNLNGLDNLAVELSYVERLEKIPASKIQRNGDRDVVTYGNGIMPLIPLDQFVQGATQRQYAEDELLSVIVHYYNDRPIGLVVRQVQDITNAPASFLRSDPPQRGLRGCVIRGDQIINILDLQEIMVLYNLPPNSNAYPQTIDMFTS